MTFFHIEYCINSACEGMRSVSCSQVLPVIFNSFHFSVFIIIYGKRLNQRNRENGDVVKKGKSFDAGNPFLWSYLDERAIGILGSIAYPICHCVLSVWIETAPPFLSPSCQLAWSGDR